MVSIRCAGVEWRWRRGWCLRMVSVEGGSGGDRGREEEVVEEEEEEEEEGE